MSDGAWYTLGFLLAVLFILLTLIGVGFFTSGDEDV